MQFFPKWCGKWRVFQFLIVHVVKNSKTDSAYTFCSSKQVASNVGQIIGYSVGEWNTIFFGVGINSFVRFWMKKVTTRQNLNWKFYYKMGLWRKFGCRKITFDSILKRKTSFCAFSCFLKTTILWQFFCEKWHSEIKNWQQLIILQRVGFGKSLTECQILNPFFDN